MNKSGKTLIDGLMRVADKLHEKNAENQQQKRRDDEQADRVNQRVKENLKKFYERLDSDE